MLVTLFGSLAWLQKHGGRKAYLRLRLSWWTFVWLAVGFSAAVVMHNGGGIGLGRVFKEALDF